jgi:Protein of unknown function (DUF3147)
MKARLNLSALHQTRWYEFVVRFIVGGLVTALVGVVAKKLGPAIGGMFLAFPAIFPSSATLVEKHEEEKEQRQGSEGKQGGRAKVGYDAAGAAMGAGGLLVFAALVWRFLPVSRTWLVLAAATLAWFAASMAIWRIFAEKGRH